MYYVAVIHNCENKMYEILCTLSIAVIKEIYKYMKKYSFLISLKYRSFRNVAVMNNCDITFQM